MKKEHILIIRFSALGDVAMVVPVVSSLARQYPDLRITVFPGRGRGRAARASGVRRRCRWRRGGRGPGGRCGRSGGRWRGGG